MSDFLWGLLAGFLISLFIVVGQIAKTNKEPQEQKMIDKCQQINSELESYNWTTFKCTNGARFDIDERG